jgi:hypothetical protein
MIACSLLIYASIWVLAIGSLITSFHLAWTNRNHLKLRRRVHHLEMDREFPGYWDEHHDVIEEDRWS